MADVPITREWLSTLDGSSNVNVKARVEGYLLKQDYKEGSVVNAGDLLFEIDPRPFEEWRYPASAHLARRVVRIQHDTESHPVKRSR